MSRGAAQAGPRLQAKPFGSKANFPLQNEEATIYKGWRQHTGCLCKQTGGKSENEKEAAVFRTATKTYQAASPPIGNRTKVLRPREGLFHHLDGRYAGYMGSSRQHDIAGGGVVHGAPKRSMRTVSHVSR